MSKKKIKSIEDYVNSTKKEKESEDFPFFDSFAAMFPSPLELGIVAGVIILGIIAILVFVHCK